MKLLSNLFLVAVTVITVALSGCMNVRDPDQVTKMPIDQLCETYYFTRHPAAGTSTDWPTKQADIKKELTRRQAVTPDEWALIDQDHIEMDMGECALKAAWGFPLRVTQSVAPAGNVSRYIYSVSRYVELTNGKVTGFHY